MVVLKSGEPELSNVLAELFNICLQESCFPDCWKVSWMVPVFRHAGEKSTTKPTNALLFFFLWQVFEKLINNRIVDHQENVDFFLISSMVFGLLNQLQSF